MGYDQASLHSHLTGTLGSPSGQNAAVCLVVSCAVDDGTGDRDREAGPRHRREILLAARGPITACPWAESLAPCGFPGRGQLFLVADAAGPFRKLAAHAFRGERCSDGPCRTTTAPERCSPRLGETPVVSQSGRNAPRHDIIERRFVQGRVLAVMAAAQGDLTRQHPAQLRGRRGITLKIVHRRALEVIRRDPPRCPGQPRALPSPVALLRHANRIPASVGQP